MSDKKLQEQKKQAQLDEWKAEVDKLKAKASGASADAQLELNKEIEALEAKIAQRKAKLDEVVDDSKEAGEALKDGGGSAWDSIKSAFRNAAGKFKK